MESKQSLINANAATGGIHYIFCDEEVEIVQNPHNLMDEEIRLTGNMSGIHMTHEAP